MTKPGTLGWFAEHELRLAWRDWAWLLSGGHSRHWLVGGIGLVIVVMLMHGLAYVTLPRATDFAAAPDKPTLVVITGALALYGSLMLSQALESVTRAFYARGDLDLVLSSPADSRRLFAVRIGAITVSVAALSLTLGAPVIDVVAWRGGAHWLAAYGVMAALAMILVAISTAVTILLFIVIGPRRTRFVAQIIAAIVGASFVIGIQFFAILSIGSMSRIEFLQSRAVIDRAPDAGNALWLPAYAAAGDWSAFPVVMVAGIAALAGAVRFGAPRFAALALASSAVSQAPARTNRRRSSFSPKSPAQVLRRKEWVLLRRDPWLISQSLMQLLYLLPPFFLLWRSYYGDSAVTAVLVPVLIMAAGQLAGGLAWLAVSGEDAPDLISSAPVRPARVWLAKAEAVAGVIGLVFAPAVAVLAIADAMNALIALLGIVTATVSASLIQFWFRAQVKRSLFRRRHVSSRIATFAEAFSSITWSGAGAAALVNPWLAVLPGGVALGVLAGSWAISPRGADAATRH